MNKIITVETHQKETIVTGDSKYTDSAHALFVISQPKFIQILFLHSSYALPSERGVGLCRMAGSRREFEPST